MDTPWRKLGLAAGGHLVLVHRPTGWSPPGLPDEVTVTTRRPEAPLDDAVVVAFYRRAARYHAEIEALAAAVFPTASLWVAWPRRAGGHESDLTDNVVRAAALPLGLVDNKVAAIDRDWSGLRLVWRREMRAGAGRLPTGR